MEPDLPKGRAALLASIPRWYSGSIHFLLINMVSLLAILVLLGQVSGLTWWQGLFVPVFFIFANLVEWLVHRGPMHHRRPGLAALHQRHTLQHHVVFTADRPAIDHNRELRWVLFPPFVLPLLLGLTAPIPLALLLVSRNLSCLFLACAIGYYLVYEWFHLVHHLPDSGGTGAMARAMRRIRQHHLRHHRPDQMTAGNFNVSFPLWDWLLGTRLTLPVPAAPVSASPGSLPVP